MAAEPEKLSAAQRSKVRKLATPKELAPDEEGGELNIVPFLDIIMNVLMFVLATVTTTFTATIDTLPPKAGGHGPKPTDAPTLGLTILIVPEGFSMKAKGGNVGPGCDSIGGGLAVAKAGADYDYPAVTRCVAKLKGSNDAFADETNVTISANPNIPYSTVIGTIDAVRKTEDGKELFPDVNFGLAK